MVTPEEQYKFGILETAFKFQPREHVTCFNNGRYFFYSSILMSQKLVNDPRNSELSYNYNDTLVKFFNLCNIWDTIEGLIFLNIWIHLWDKKFD